MLNAGHNTKTAAHLPDYIEPQKKEGLRRAPLSETFAVLGNTFI